MFTLGRWMSDLRIGVLAEAEADLYMEQVVLPGVTAWFETCFGLATDHGYDPEFLVLEMYASGEMSEVFQLTAVDGDQGLTRAKRQQKQMDVQATSCDQGYSSPQSSAGSQRSQAGRKRSWKRAPGQRRPSLSAAPRATTKARKVSW